MKIVSERKLKEHSLFLKKDYIYREEVIGIDIMKAFFAICVVAIHTHPYLNFQSGSFSVMRCMDILLLSAVPFFFITTGYFMGEKLSARFSNAGNKVVLKYYLIKYLKLYLLWTGIYLPITLYYYIALSDRSAVWMIMDFFRGLIFRGEHWNSWMLWYLLSIIYALLIFSIIRYMKGSYCAVYIISFVLFALSGIYENCLNV